MKTIVIFFLCMILSSISFGQIEEEKLMHVDVDEVMVVPPKFTGVKNVIPMMKEGKFESLEDYMSKNIQYPEKDIKRFSQGTEVIQFVKPRLVQKSDISAKVRQLFFSDPFSLQPKQLQSDYVSI